MRVSSIRTDPRSASHLAWTLPTDETCLHCQELRSRIHNLAGVGGVKRLSTFPISSFSLYWLSWTQSCKREEDTG